MDAFDRPTLFALEALPAPLRRTLTLSAFRTLVRETTPVDPALWPEQVRAAYRAVPEGEDRRAYEAAAAQVARAVHSRAVVERRYVEQGVARSFLAPPASHAPPTYERRAGAEEGDGEEGEDGEDGEEADSRRAAPFARRLD